MKAYIENIVNGRTYQVKKDSVEELNDFIAYQKNKARCPWGALEKNLVVDPAEYPERAIFVEEVISEEPKLDENSLPVLEDGEAIVDENGEPVLDEEGNPTFEQVPAMEEVVMHRVRVPQEFTVLVDEVPEDLTSQYHAEMQKKVEKVLDATDWLFVSDVVIPPAYRQAYIEYRQVLRDHHSRDISTFSNEESFNFESFDNFMRRTRSNEFLDGGSGEAIISKFEAKL